MITKKTKNTLIVIAAFLILLITIYILLNLENKTSQNQTTLILTQADEAYKNKNYSEALELYKKIVDSQGKEKVSSDIYDKMGVSSYNLSNLDQAIEYYSDSLAKVDNVKVKNSLANAYRDKGEIDKAIEICKQIITDNPDYKYTPVYDGLLQLLMTKKDYDGVIEYGNKFLGTEGDYTNLSDEQIKPSVMLTLASAYKNKEDNQKYQEIIERLKKFDPESFKDLEKDL